MGITMECLLGHRLSNITVRNTTTWVVFKAYAFFLFVNLSVSNDGPLPDILLLNIHVSVAGSPTEKEYRALYDHLIDTHDYNPSIKPSGLITVDFGLSLLQIHSLVSI